MSNFLSQAFVSAEFKGKVVRCGCTDEQKEAADWHAKLGEVCPNPAGVEDLGILARMHRNPIINTWWKFKLWLDR